MAREIDPQAVEDTIVALLYGLSNCGKTALASAFGQAAAYIAAESASQRLATWFGKNPPKKVIIPDGNWDPKTGKLDWRRETFSLAQRDWAAEGYDVLIWDTWSSTNEELLRESARKNWFSEKGPVTGSHDPKIDEDKKYAQPQQGDYMMAQQLGLQAIEFLIKQRTSVIITCYEGLSEPDPGRGQLLLFGPQTVGSKGPRQLPHRFDATLWLAREKDADNPKGDLKVHMRTTDKHVCGVKTRRVGEVPPFKILRDEGECREFWQWLLSLKKEK